MNYTRLWAAAVVIALVVVVGFVLSVPHTRDAARTPTAQSETINIPFVMLHDTFKKGVHTITGSLEAPNACALVTARAAFLDASSSAATIRIMLSLSEETGVCLQVPTRLDFSATIAAPAHVPLTATVNGSVATTTVL